MLISFHDKKYLFSEFIKKVILKVFRPFIDSFCVLKTGGVLVYLKFIKAKYNKNKNSYFCYLEAMHRKFSIDKIKEDLCNEFESDMKYKLNFENPRTFCEKIYWLRLFGGTEKKTILADKFKVREYVKSIAGEKYLIPLYGVWNNFDEIDFDALPNSFVLKTNHGCGFNYIVKDKTKFDKKDARKCFKFWMNSNYALWFWEMQYLNIPRKIIAEKYIEQMDGNLYDYKIHCFKGIPQYLQLIGDRDLKTHGGFQAFFDMDFRRSPFTLGNYPEYNKGIKVPKCWKEMVELAKKLSNGIDYCRVDLYEIDGNVYLGEITCTPGGGNYPKIEPKEWDLKLGEMIDLDSAFMPTFCK